MLEKNSSSQGLDEPAHLHTLARVFPACILNASESFLIQLFSLTH